MVRKNYLIDVIRLYAEVKGRLFWLYLAVYNRFHSLDKSVQHTGRKRALSSYSSDFLVDTNIHEIARKTSGPRSPIIITTSIKHSPLNISVFFSCC
jgi:hypothetical protein